ncbi:hypothetical protein D3C81_1837410 [compost metagenome]
MLLFYFYMIQKVKGNFPTRIKNPVAIAIAAASLKTFHPAAFFYFIVFLYGRSIHQACRLSYAFDYQKCCYRKNTILRSSPVQTRAGPRSKEHHSFRHTLALERSIAYTTGLFPAFLN